MNPSFFESLREATFRGVPFEVESADESGGRRLARHEYPLRDVPYAEDLGRKAGEWSIEAYIVQGRKYDYAKARDALRDALKERGPGTLMHPTLGDITVAVDSYRLKESTREGGYCTFSITFVEPGQPESPTSKADTAHAAKAAGQAARAAGLLEFPKLYIPLPQELLACAAALAEGVELAMAYLTLPQQIIAEALGYAQSLVAQPLALAGALYGMFGQLLGSLPLEEAKALGYAGPEVAPAFMVAPSDSIASPTFQGGYHRDSAALNSLLFRNPVTHTASITALRQQVAQTLLLEDALATATRDYATADDALAARTATLEGLDVVAPVLTDSLFAAHAGVRLAVAQDLTTRGGQLPRVRRVTLPATVPALVAAYSVHGDAKREAEIVSRNRIRHPGRVPGNTLLEVLSK